LAICRRLDDIIPAELEIFLADLVSLSARFEPIGFEQIK
jgi:hypothetical protein